MTQLRYMYAQKTAHQLLYRCFSATQPFLPRQPNPHLILLQLLLNRPRNLARRALELAITVGIPPPSAEAQPNCSWPRAALEQQHRENDSEPGAERRLNDKVGEALIPLHIQSAMSALVEEGGAGGPCR